MTNTPFYVQNARSGFRMGNQNLIDGMIHDGLWDPYNNQHMGNCARALREGEKLSRAKCRTSSRSKASSARKPRKRRASSRAKSRPSKSPVKKATSRSSIRTKVRRKALFDKIPTLKPVFDKAGTVTAANSSTINDGACAVVLMSAEKAKQLGVKPLARVVSYGTTRRSPCGSRPRRLKR